MEMYTDLTFIQVSKIKKNLTFNIYIYIYAFRVKKRKKIPRIFNPYIKLIKLTKRESYD